MPLNIPAIARKQRDFAARLADSALDAVTHIAITGRSATGPIYATTGVARKALVELTTETVASLDGTERVAGAKFTFVTPFTIKERERLVHDGVTHTVIKVEGPTDPATHKPYFPIVWTGKL
jgi:hypothetical protein